MNHSHSDPTKALAIATENSIGVASELRARLGRGEHPLTASERQWARVHLRDAQMHLYALQLLLGDSEAA